MDSTKEEKEQKLRKQRKWARDYRKKNLKYNAMLEEQIETLRKENDNLRERIKSLYDEIQLYTPQGRIVNNASQQIPLMLQLQGSPVLPEAFVEGSTFQPAYIAPLTPTMYAPLQFLPNILPMQVPDTVTGRGKDVLDSVHENNIGFIPSEHKVPPEM